MMMTDLTAFCRELKLGAEEQALLTPVWEKLIEDWDGALPFFLDQEYFDRLYPYCAGNYPLSELRPYTEAVIGIARKNPAAALLAHIAHRGAFVLRTPVELDFLPDPLPLFGEKYSGVFSLMISLGVYPLMVQAYARAGVPEKYAQDALPWMGGTMQMYSLSHPGVPGRPFRFMWIRHYAKPELFRLGRLEFLMQKYSDQLPLIYRGPGGRLAALCREDWGFRADGRRAWPGETPDFVTPFVQSGETVTGVPCRPDGTVGDWRHPVTLDTREWKPVASAWDLCPSIHIPGGARMPFDEVKQSLLTAREFFARYFHKRVPLFSCISWILNPAWESLLQNSNMVRFRQECFAFPAPHWGNNPGMAFVFGRSDVEPSELPAANPVQRAFQAAWRAGKLSAGGLFVLTDDLEKLGSRYYREAGLSL